MIANCYFTEYRRVLNTSFLDSSRDINYNNDTVGWSDSGNGLFAVFRKSLLRKLTVCS